MKKDNNHVCPVWMAYTFDNPFRKLIHNPKKIFKEYVREGMTVMDLGCGLGCFSIDLAKMVGKEGKVFSVDLQAGMLDRLMKRAKRAGIADIIETHQCSADTISIADKLDFALAFWMIHETPDAHDFLKQIHNLLKPDGILFLADPKMHVSQKNVNELATFMEDIGYQVIEKPKVSMSYVLVLKKG
jgi:ubiquinone/menaquinone biosynthesis C-methylase UbiE